MEKMNNFNRLSTRALLYFVVMGFLLSCSAQGEAEADPEEQYAAQREAMVTHQLAGRDVSDRDVLDAMRTVPRHLFVPKKYRDESYRDHPLPIGEGQTISQPYIVGIMTQLLAVDSTSKVLEIGTGSGYQAAVLAEICDSVFSIEIVEPLAARAEYLLDSLGYKVKVRCGDGYRGWEEHAPYDGIIVTAAAPKIPQPLIDQLKVGGRLVIPVGDYSQDLMVITKTEDGFAKKNIFGVRFVPMTGEVQKK
jgi:protein-L-isoaspartate(D-aspartate) O-methyltransferase